MTKAEQVEAIAAATGLTAVQARAALNAIFGLVAVGLVQDGGISVGGLGTFSARRRGARRVRNPATGVLMDVPPSASVSFRPSAELRDAVKTRWSDLS